VAYFLGICRPVLYLFSELIYKFYCSDNLLLLAMFRLRPWARIQTLGTLTPHPLYQLRTVKTFNKRNQIYKYVVVYLNGGNDFYVAKYMSKMLPVPSSTSLQKSWMLNFHTILSLQTLERTGMRWFCPLFGRPIPIKSISFRGFSPDPLTRVSAAGPRWGLRPHTPLQARAPGSRARHVLAPEPLNQTPVMHKGVFCYC